MRKRFSTGFSGSLSASRRGRAAAGLLLLKLIVPLALLPRLQAAQTMWTNAGSGKWEIASNWSAGAPMSLVSVFITNAGTKTVTIDATTSGSFSNTMTVNDLFIDSPTGSVNTLSLSAAGLAVPLRVLNVFEMTNSSVMVVNNSEVKADGGIGVGGTRNLVLITNAGRLTSAGANIGAGAGSGTSNSVQVTGTGSLWNNTGGFLGVANSSGYTAIVVSNGGAFAGGNATIGWGATANDQTVVVTDVASTWSNALLYLSHTGARFIVSNGASAFSSSAIIGEAAGSNRNVLITGANSVWSSTGTVQVGVGGGTNDGLTVTNGGALIVTNAAHTARVDVNQAALIVSGGDFKADNLSLSNMATANISTNLLIGSGGTVTVENSSLQVGGLTTIGSSNTGTFTLLSGSAQLWGDLEVGSVPGSRGALDLSGGTLWATGYCTLGIFSTATGAVSVTGGQLILTNNQTRIGNSGVGQMIVSNGTVKTLNLSLGNGGGAQGTLIVAGGIVSNVGGTGIYIGDGSSAIGSVTLASGSLSSGLIAVGQFGIGNLTIAGGTLNLPGGAIEVGRLAGSRGTLTITGGTSTVPFALTVGRLAHNSTANATMSGGALYVTNPTHTAVLSVLHGSFTLDGGMLAADSVVVGDCASNASGVLTINGGTLIVTNSTHTATLDVRQSALVLNGGTLIVDRLITTNGCGFFVQNGGTLVANSLAIVTQPQSQTVVQGDNVSFNVAVSGSSPVFQWRKGGTNLAGATGMSLNITNAQVTNAGNYDIVAANATGAVTSQVAMLSVLMRPAITVQPMSQTVTNGATNITFSVTNSGTGPFRYQWRLNGVNIPGATNSTYTVAVVTLAKAGAYAVVVANDADAITSDPAILTVTVTAILPGDNFVDRAPISNLSGTISGTNSYATREAGEPQHAGRPGSNSVWYSWTAPSNAIATFNTLGSAFDTLLAVYTGGTVSNLTEVASGDDEGGFATSRVRFNARAGTNYAIAIDGFGGANGRYTLGWSNEVTSASVPVITAQPLTRTVTNGMTAVFSVTTTTNGSPFKYQWLFNTAPLAGATNASLTISNVQPTNVGVYQVLVTNNSNNFFHSVASALALLEIGPFTNVHSVDKLEEVLPPPGSGFAAPKGGPQALASSAPVIPVSFGTIGAQIFNNTTNTTQQQESNHCMTIGGASSWFVVKPTADGILVLDTEGSSINTVLAVYTGNFYDGTRRLVACNNDAAPGVTWDRVRFAATNNVEYQVAVDSVNGVKGNVKLNWALGQPPAYTGPTANRTGLVGGNLALDASAISSSLASSLQWQFDGNYLADQTSPTLSLAGLQSWQAGRYDVVISNLAGTVTNFVALLSVQTVIAGTNKFVGSEFQLNMLGVPNASYVFEATRALGTEPWTPIGTAQAGMQSNLTFSDSTAAGLTNRAYRVRLGP